jgi:ribosomal protein S18 acetylase RimI-like enzyme
VLFELEVEKLKPEDLNAAAHLIQNFWSLNVEFEPDIELEENSLSLIRQELERNIEREEDELLFVAKTESGLVGFIRIEIKSGTFHGPKRWGNIVEFYVLPRARRKAVARSLLETTLDKLKAMGIERITAEFPTQNIPAANFYEKNGFHPLMTVYVKDLGSADD